MSDQSDQLHTCPNCGQENALHSLKCIRCGESLQDLFAFDEFEVEDPLANEDEEATGTIADVLASLEENPLMEPPSNLPEEDSDGLEEDEGGTSPNSGRESIPDWLERVRQRAREEDAGGELAKGAQAMDAKRASDGRQQVDQAFDGMLRRIREQAENERKRTRRQESNLVDENGDPEWLRRIRELHPKQEDDTKQVHTEPTVTDELDQEWTEEELQELLRREIGAQELEDQESARDDGLLIETEPSEFALPEIPLYEQDSEDDLSESSAVLISGEEPVHDPTDLHSDSEQVNDKAEEGRPLLIEDFAESEESLEVSPWEEPLPEESESNDEEVLAASEAVSPETAVEEALVVEDIEETEILLEAAAVKISENEESDPQEELSENHIEAALPDLLFLRGQRDRAQVLTNIIEQEGRRTIAVLHEKSRQGKLGRLILALLLIVGIVGALILGPAQSLDLAESLPVAAFDENFETLEPGRSLMVILDYQAATSVEMEALAKPLLEELHDKGINIAVFTAKPMNLWLASSLLDGVNGQSVLKNLEFIPGGLLGYLSLAAGTNPGWGETPLQASLLDGGRLFKASDQVLIISDSFESVRGWIEQIAPWQAGKSVSVISTGVNYAFLLPYFESGQLRGVMAGMTDREGAMSNQRAWQVGMLFMMVVLVLGMITKADADMTHREEARDHA